ncbi:hypothetical protein ACFQH3_08545 [Haladaptatus sp. GCM10025707]|uniref:hypothetical protein n=1 Tax=unclassified Haladaptatus TaxID=2622732 RepID=UPI0023E78A9A|nr:MULTISPECIES: hypothetical protein [unclassified Haladaptatus]
MSPTPSVTLDVETAAAFRDWLFETGVENHAKPQIANPLAELAAAIDSELHDNTEYVEISASTAVFPSTDHVTVVDDDGSPPHQESEEPTWPVDTVSVDDADSDPCRRYDDLPDDAWYSRLDQYNAAKDKTPSVLGQSTSLTTPPHTQGEADRISVRYLTSYECSVCGSIRELETSLQMCAFVDDCAACGTINVRFTAIGIPEPIHK